MIGPTRTLTWALWTATALTLAMWSRPAAAEALPACQRNNSIVSCDIAGTSRAFSLASASLYLPKRKAWGAKLLRANCQPVHLVPAPCDWVAALSGGTRAGSAVNADPHTRSEARPSQIKASVRAPPRPVSLPKAHAPSPKGVPVPLAESSKVRGVGYQPLREPLPNPKAWRSRDCAWRPEEVDSTRLAAVMRARGFRPPAHFRAFVAAVDVKADRIASLKAWDYDGHADDVGGWNPASTVKIFTTVGAIEFARSQGFSVSPKVRMKYPRGEVEYSLAQLVWAAIWNSDNIAHDRVAQIAGFDELHGPRGVLARAGLRHTAVMKAYQLRDWEGEGQDRSLRVSPAMTLVAGKRTVVVPPRTGETKSSCGGSACTTLQDLSRMMCVVMLHEQLPSARRLHLGLGKDAAMLRYLREALQARRVKGRDGVWEALAAQFPGRGAGASATWPLWRKGGFSEDWISDNFFIRGKGSRRWLVSMSAFGGRKALDGAASAIALILRHNDLTDRPKAGRRRPAG